MSNKSLIERIEISLSELRKGTGTIRSLADAVRLNGQGLESIPMALHSEIESLASSLDVAAWHDEDGFCVELEPILLKLETWLSKIPH